MITTDTCACVCALDRMALRSQACLPLCRGRHAQVEKSRTVRMPWHGELFKVLHIIGNCASWGGDLVNAARRQLCDAWG